MMALELHLCLMTACQTTLVVSTRLYGTHSYHFSHEAPLIGPAVEDSLVVVANHRVVFCCVDLTSNQWLDKNFREWKRETQIEMTRQPQFMKGKFGPAF